MATPQKMNCPDCGLENEAALQHCQRCGARLHPEDLAQQTERSRGADDAAAARRVMALTSLVLGIGGLLIWGFDWIRHIGTPGFPLDLPLVAWPLMIVGIVLGLLGLKSARRRVAIAGLVTSSAALGATLGMLAWAWAAFPEGNRDNASRRRVEILAMETERAPRDAADYIRRAQSYDTKGRYEEAVAAYSEAIRLEPDSEEAQFNLGTDFANLQRYEKAVEAFHKAIRLNPRDARPQLGLGLAYSQMGHHKESLEAYKEAARLKPDWPAAHWGLGWAYANLGRMSEAQVEYKKLKDLHRDLAEMFRKQLEQFKK